MEQIRLAAEATERRRAEARRTRTRFNPTSRVNERFWTSPHNVAADHFGATDGSGNPAQRRPEGDPVNNTGHILDGVEANLGRTEGSQVPPRENEPPLTNPVPDSTIAASNQMGSNPSGPSASGTAADPIQPENVGAFPHAQTPPFFSHQFSHDEIDSFLNDDVPEGHVQSLDPPVHPGIIPARRQRGSSSEEQTSKRPRFEEVADQSQAVMEIQQRPIGEQADILINSATAVSIIPFIRGVYSIISVF